MVFHFPQTVSLGQGMSQRLGLLTKDLGSRVLLLVDSAYDGSKELGILTHSLERASVPYLVLSRGARETMAEALAEATTVARASRMGVLAVLGGPDQLALGRSAINSLGEKTATPYFEIPTFSCYPLLLRPEVFLSTGHPSDVRFVPFTSPSHHHVLLDPYMATGQSSKAAVSSLLEALFYAVETFLHQNAGLTEQSLLLGAIEKIWSTLHQIYENPANAEYRLLTTQAGFNIMAAASLLPRGTGMTFAFVLAGLAGISTGAFGSLLLAPLLEDYSHRAGTRVLALSQAFGQEAGDESTVGPKIAQDVRKFLNAHQLPLRLADYKLVDTQLTQAVDVVRGMEILRGGVLEPDHLPDFVRSVL